MHRRAPRRICIGCWAIVKQRGTIVKVVDKVVDKVRYKVVALEGHHCLGISRKEKEKGRHPLMENAGPYNFCSGRSDQRIHVRVVGLRRRISIML